MNKDILNLIKEGKYVQARKEIINKNIVDIAHLFEEIEHKSLLIMFRMLPKDMASGVFTHISVELQQYIVESVTDEEVTEILDELFFDDAIDFIEEMPANVVKKVLRNTDYEKRNLINQFLDYPEDSAGSIMTIEYVDLKKEMTVKEAIEYIKKTGVDKATIDTCFVMDNQRILEGNISLRKLILSEETDIIGDIMETNDVKVNTHDDQEEIAILFKKYDYIVMPVVDNENRLVGIVTIDDIVDVIDEEATEDFQKMAAMEPSEKEYLKTSPLQLARHRVPWLLVLMISATFTGGIIRKYDYALQSVTVLAAFIPMLMDTGGNSGSQSSTLVIRGLALGNIEIKDIFKIMWKEFQVSIIAGTILSLVNFARIFFLEKVGLLVSITVSITLFITVMLSKIVGGLLPVIAKRLKLDPAIMAGPLITTIVDTVTLIVYFGIATWLLGI